MADPHSGEEQNELTSRSPDTLTFRKSTVFGTDPALLRDLVEIAKHEFELKQREIEVEQQQIAHEHEYMKLALDAHTAECDADRRTRQNERREKMLFSLVGAGVLAAFLIVCMRMGQTQIAMDAIKSLGLVLVSGYGGYQYAARKFSRDKD
jgi:hypothetical protein